MSHLFLKKKHPSLVFIYIKNTIGDNFIYTNNLRAISDMIFNDLNTIFGVKDGSDDEDDILDPSPSSNLSITRPKNCVIFYCFTLFFLDNNIH